MPQQSIARDDATPSFSLMLTRDILRSIYIEEVLQRPASLKAENDKYPFNNDDDLMDFPDRPECAPPPPSNQTATGDSLSHAEIARLHADGIDPFAIAVEGSAHVQQPKLPIFRMICAARFAAIFENPDKVGTYASPQAVSLIALPDDGERAVFADYFPDILKQTAKALGSVDSAFENIVLAMVPDVWKSSSERYRADFRDKVDRLIAKGKSVIVLATHHDDLPSSAKVICNPVTPLPKVTGDMVIEILRQTHSTTGQLSESAIRDRLPTDARLQKLPMPLFKSTFHEATTLKVALRLHVLCDRAEDRPSTIAVNFDDIYLPQKARDDMLHLVSDLFSWRDGELEWSEVTSSVLLFGPPGTGKTLLAQTFAGSAGIPLITTSYGDCQRAGHQGDFLRTLSEKVEQAVDQAPAVFFIDELDSFSNRSKSHRNSGYIAGIVNALLEHLTRLNNTPGVIVLGATNLPANVDPAIIRPGRFDRHTALENPDRVGIRRIFEIALGGETYGLNLGGAVDRLLGLSGAEVTAVVRDARGKARRDQSVLSEKHLSAALDRVAPQGRSNDLHRIAIHEAGHTVVAHNLGLPLPEMVRVTARGGVYLGKMPIAATKRIVDSQIAATLGGRAAEECILGSVSDGAASDLRQATELAFRARYNWGLFANNLLSLNLQKMTELDPLSPLGSVVNADLKAHYLKTKEIVENNKSLIYQVAEALLEQREMDGNALKKVLATTNSGSSNDSTVALEG